MLENQDERYYVADIAIRDAFFLVLKKKPLERITVADIIRQAGIVRSTFYNHYENIPMLIEAIEKKTIDDIFSFLKQFHPENDRDICMSYFSTLCQYTMTNPLLSEFLRTAQGDHFFEQVMHTFHRYVSEVTQSLDLSHKDKSPQSFAISYIIGGTVGVLHKWTRENFQTPLEDIANMLTDIFMNSLLPLFS